MPNQKQRIMKFNKSFEDEDLFMVLMNRSAHKLKDSLAKPNWQCSKAYCFCQKEETILNTLICSLGHLVHNSGWLQVYLNLIACHKCLAICQELAGIEALSLVRRGGGGQFSYVGMSQFLERKNVSPLHVILSVIHQLYLCAMLQKPDTKDLDAQASQHFALEDKVIFSQTHGRHSNF